MKRILSLMLALTLCFMLSACYDPSTKLYNKFVPDADGGDAKDADDGEESGEFTLIGDWLRVSDGLKVTLKENGVCIIKETEVKYGYDEKLGIVSLYGAVTQNYNLVKEDGLYKLFIDDEDFLVPAADYEQAHKEYIESTYIPTLTEGKTELVEGVVNQTSDGTTFSIQNAELIIEGDKCYLSFEVTFDGDFDIGQTRYESPRSESLFSIMEESRSENSAKYVYPVDMPTDEVTEDARDFGMLELDIGGINYYIAAKEFVDISEAETPATESKKPEENNAEPEEITITVISDSMQPTLSKGDVVRCTRVSDAANLAIGDIICYWTVIDGERVTDTGRIVNIYDGGGYFIFETKGDADAATNPLTVHESEIVGMVDAVIG